MMLSSLKDRTRATTDISLFGENRFDCRGSLTGKLPNIAGTSIGLESMLIAYYGQRVALAKSSLSDIFRLGERENVGVPLCGKMRHTLSHL